jgi:hypothetical protein
MHPAAAIKPHAIPRHTMLCPPPDPQPHPPQVDLLKEVAEGKDKEIRAALLEAKQLRGKLEEVRRAGARRVQDLTAQLQVGVGCMCTAVAT